MVIVNQHGAHNVSSSQYNYLVHNFRFEDIDKKKVQQTNFINSSWEYEKADEIFKDIKE